MKKIILATTILALSASSAFAAVKTYQVTGPVLALSADSITVQKGAEKWEIARDATTQIPASVKVGSKVTIKYSMSAASVEDKSPADAKAAPADAKATAPADAKPTTSAAKPAKKK